MLLVHATAVEVDGAGVLLRGPSGSGKSDLALRLIDRGASLIADDQVELSAEADGLIARAPAPIAGKMEVRGLGIIETRHKSATRLALVVDLDCQAGPVERMPVEAKAEYLGRLLPLLRLDAFEASADAKLRLAAANASRCAA
ncbi:MAG: hypothetical protein FJX47_01195 [Alphaproteobacteria bacterium]|nr:hypothetical protein [Alphaproteobacteria bacterium]